MIDREMMRLCLAEALKAEGRTSPNPLVGACVVDENGGLLACGYHHGLGQPHAEVDALVKLGGVATGKTIYVNLEPCCHFGRTPPCTLRLIEAGIKKVVVPFLDPFAQVAGKGVMQLRERGIEVVVDDAICGDLAAYVNRGFFKTLAEKLPWVTLKMAMTLDGKIADRFGASRYVTGNASRQAVMRLRNRYDCVLIGAGTARLDNPSLDVRLEFDCDGAREPSPLRNPLKAILDTNLSLPASLRLFDTTMASAVIFYRDDLPVDVVERRLHEVSSSSSSLRFIPVESRAGRLHLPAVLQILCQLGVNKVLCEGGSGLATGLLQENLVDELVWFVAPKLLYDDKALNVVGNSEPRSIADIQSFVTSKVGILGEDVRIDLLHERHRQFKNVLAEVDSLKSY
jgi:diaminohydroxyphosphoribosylaminopyrimidine deaminase/5-amino-6-(5-phosphoribosylamino)uracil reductase